jgi:hypothetical protein
MTSFDNDEIINDVSIESRNISENFVSKALEKSNVRINE